MTDHYDDKGRPLLAPDPPGYREALKRISDAQKAGDEKAEVEAWRDLYARAEAGWPADWGPR